MSISVQFFNILAVKNPKTLYQITKAKKNYISSHHECAVCGNKNHLECHHAIPVHINIDLSCEFDNFITLCDANNNGCHRWIGHFGNFKSKWNTKVRQYAIASRLFLEKMEPDRIFIVPTTQLIDEYSKALNISTPSFLEDIQLFNK